MRHRQGFVSSTGLVEGVPDEQSVGITVPVWGGPLRRQHPYLFTFPMPLWRNGGSRRRQECVSGPAWSRQDSPGKNSTAPKAMDPAPAPKDVDVTGSVDQTDKAPRPQGEKPAPVSQAQAGEVKARPAKVENEPEEWAEVSLAAKVHDAPSVSAPTVRLYGVGTKLRVIGRAPGWIKVVDPTTSQEGWIYEKYLTPREGPDQKQAGLPQPSQRQVASGMPNDVNVSAPTQPEPDARSKRLRKYGWKWPRAYRPPIGFAFRVW